jgi:LysM repeat protein
MDFLALRGRYEVQRGDTVDSLSLKFDISVGNLRKWNRLYGNEVYPSQVYPLCIILQIF